MFKKGMTFKILENTKSVSVLSRKTKQYDIVDIEI